MQIVWRLCKRFGASTGLGRACGSRRCAAAVGVCLFALVGCGGEAPPTRLELADLARFTDQYDGERVSTSGHVRSHSDPEHYWLEDADLNRVAVHPDSAVKALVGQRVRVVGAFRYSREKGRAIEAEGVEVLDDAESEG